MKTSPPGMSLPDSAAAIGQAAFWPPAWVSGPAFADHAPVLFWLAETVRPATVLGLGLLRGDGFFALAQAAAGLDLPTRLWGHGAWPQTVPAALARHNAQHHAAMLRLTPASDVGALLARYGAGMFDLVLVEDGIAEDSDLQTLAVALAAAVTPRGVIVVQGRGERAQRLVAVLGAGPGDASGDASGAGPGCGPRVIRFGAAADGALILVGPAIEPRLAALGGPADDPSGLPAMLARLGLACLADPRLAAAAPDTPPAEALAEALAQADALRLQTLTILTAELERLTDDLRQAHAVAAAERQAAGTEARVALQAAEAALADLRIRHFDAITDLQAERDWIARDLAESKLALAAMTDLAAAQQTDLAAAREAAAALAEAEQTLARTRAAAQAALAEAQVAGAAAARRAEASLTRRLELARTEAASRAARDRLLLRLRDWKIAQLVLRGRFDQPRGPSGGPLKAEVAAVQAHPLFDPAWYSGAYPDVASTDLTPAEHFLRHGFFEGRDPGPRFRLLDWFAAHPAALEARRNPLLDPALAPTG